MIYLSACLPASLPALFHPTVFLRVSVFLRNHPARSSSPSHLLLRPLSLSRARSPGRWAFSFAHALSRAYDALTNMMLLRSLIGFPSPSWRVRVVSLPSCVCSSGSSQQPDR